MKIRKKDKDNPAVSLKGKARDIRRDILNMTLAASGGHVAPALSIADIMAVLYFYVLRLNPQDAQWPGRDRFILSKGHGCLALYAALAQRGFFSCEEMSTFCKTDSRLHGHPEIKSIPGVEVSTGSLGHGLSIGVGVGLAAKHDRLGYRVFVLIGDGECDEGSVWEAVMAAYHYRLDNIIAIIDNNKHQGMGFKEQVLSCTDMLKRWEAFGWAGACVNGHNIVGLVRTFKQLPFKKNRPSVIVADTIKGKGISFMENNPVWHFRCPSASEADIARRELT